ncbi:MULTISPECIES: ABC transporter ATP-binding protein [unclassified Phyllobacterium]|uniref:ABC transporter ATP-binding protein n=1 Tax=unclassified Phyllobacterium TaxID=2638441 RepID=UPI0030131DE9
MAREKGHRYEESPAMISPLLEVRNLRTTFTSSRGTVRSVDGVSFTLNAGEIIGMVGESGSGKSVTALSIMRLIPQPAGLIQADAMKFNGIDLLSLNERQMLDIRSNQIAMIFQDPMRSLNPVLTIGRQLTETLVRHLRLDRKAARRRAIDLLEMVGIPMAESRLNAYPHEFSGGMRQRVMIAIALSCRPSLLIADEATTALDVTVQAQIVELLKGLVKDLGTSVIWISHDLGIVANLCDRINVMYAGRIVESGTVREVFYKPSHGYTIGLMACTPRIDAMEQSLKPIPGLPPDLRNPIALCPFLPRCNVKVDECELHAPFTAEREPQHFASCFADLRSHWRS